MSLRGRWWLFVFLGLIVLAIPGAYFGQRKLEQRLRTEIVSSIERRFNAKAKIEDLRVSVFPSFEATGKKLVLRQQNQDAVPPLISLEQFSLSTSLSELASRPIRVYELNLKGLVIQVPPKRDKSSSNPNDVKAQSQTSVDQPKKTMTKKKEERADDLFLIKNINADGTVLRILPKNPEKEPLLFELYKLKLRSVQRYQPLQYEATLKNAKPPGMINTKGEFGPWQASDGGETPVSGEYNFQKADLSVFRGISGTLSSLGKFHGVLRQIEAEGTTDTPDFAVGKASTVHLKTQFKSVIDGTNGDTLLPVVVAQFRNTEVICHGEVSQRPGEKSKTVSLDTAVNAGRIEDLLQLVISGKPALVGGIAFHAQMEIPPGDMDVIKKIKLRGSFHLKRAEFTSNTIQSKIETLSMRSRGIHDDTTNERIVSDMEGSFSLSGGSIRFSDLRFTVPGARVQLAGQYGIVNERIDFHGTLAMQAKISQTQTGIKSLLLKMVDPFFKKGHAGAVLPIKITGVKSKPEFALNLGGGKD